MKILSTNVSHHGDHHRLPVPARWDDVSILSNGIASLMKRLVVGHRTGYPMGTLESVFGDNAPILRENTFRLLLLSSILPVLGSGLISPVLDSLIEPFQASAVNIGLLISVFTAPGIVMIPISGLLADRIGRKIVLVSSLLLFGVAGVGIAFTDSFAVVLFLRFLQGVGFAGINPVIITLIGDMYDGTREATGQGMRFMTSGLSGAVFPLIAGVLVTYTWRFPFLLYGMAVPIATGSYLWLDATHGTADDEAQQYDSRRYVRALLELVRHRRVLFMVFARALMPAIWIGFLTYNSLIVVRLLGGTSVQAGFLLGLVYLTMGVVASQGGRLTSVFEQRQTPLVLANVCLGIGFFCILYGPDLRVAVLGSLGLGFGLGIIGTLYRTIITDLAPKNLRGGLVSLSEAGGRVISTTIPILMGGMIAWTAPMLGFDVALRFTGFVLTAGASVASIVCVYVALVSPELS